MTPHKVFLSVGHDESGPQQRANVEAARAAGVHLGFFSGNEMYWKTRWEIASPARARRTALWFATKKLATARRSIRVPSGPALARSALQPAVRRQSSRKRSDWDDLLRSMRFGTILFRFSAQGKLRFWRNTGIDTLADGQTRKLPAGILGFEWDEVSENGFHRLA